MPWSEDGQLFCFNFFFYFSALLTLGVDDFDPNPAGGEVNKVMLEVFSKEAYVYFEIYQNHFSHSYF